MPGALLEPPWGASGAEKNSLAATGGAQVEIWSPLTSIRGRPGVDVGLRLGGARGASERIFGALFRNM